MHVVYLLYQIFTGILNQTLTVIELSLFFMNSFDCLCGIRKWVLPIILGYYDLEGEKKGNWMELENETSMVFAWEN